MLFSALICSLIVILGAEIPLALIFMAVTLIIILMFLVIYNAKPQFWVVIILSFVTICSTVLSLSRVQRLSALDKTECNVEFTVEEITYKSSGYYCADVVINKSDVLKKDTKISVSYYDGRLEMGDTAKADVVLSKIDGDYKMNYYSRNIFLAASVENYEILKDKSNLFYKGINILREYIKQTVFEYIPYNESGTLIALLLGDRTYFSNEFYNNVTLSGVSHVMVVSGLHLTIFVTLFTAVINKYFYNRYVCAFLQLFAVLLLTGVCGFTMSMLRAGVMYIIISIGLIIKRKSVSENALGAAVSLVLAVSPFVVFNVAFQLSVLSTFGILAIALPIDRYIKKNNIIKNSVLRGLFSSVIISLSATLLTLPIAINVFGFISTVGVITTLIITYPVTFSIWISVIGLIVNLLIPSFAELLFVPCEYLLKFTNYVINKMGSLPFAVVYTDKVWVYITTGIIILIFCVLIACKKRADMLKLKEINRKIIEEGGRVLKWR